MTFNHRNKDQRSQWCLNKSDLKIGRDSLVENDSLSYIRNIFIRKLISIGIQCRSQKLKCKLNQLGNVKQVNSCNKTTKN